MSVKVWMVFEAVGPRKSDVEESIEDHVESLESEDGVEIQEIEKDEIEEMENPHPSLEKGYSQVLELRVGFKSFHRAMESVINYGPTYVQMEGPDNYNMKLSEAQETLQQVATTMHQYAQKGVGGVLVSKSSEQKS